MSNDNEIIPYRCYVCARKLEGIRIPEDIMMAFEEGELFLDNRLIYETQTEAEKQAGIRRSHSELELLCMECVEKRHKVK